MTRISHLLLTTLLAGSPSLIAAQAVTPADHPGFMLAEAIAADGCTLHQDDVNALLTDLGLEAPQFPEMAVPLMRDGYLMPGGEGMLILVNWGLCTGEVLEEAEEVDAVETQPADEITATETE